MFGLESLKPVLTALVLPPVPLLLLVLFGARVMGNRRAIGFMLVFLSTVLLWLSCCSGIAVALQNFSLRPPPVLSSDAITEWKTGKRNGTPTPSAAIVVLGGGRDRRAAEYGVSNLQAKSLERLRYGLWLARETGLPVAFSGGVGWGQDGDAPEAEVAGRIARDEFNRPLRWTEARSRDTRENAALTVPLLREAGVREIILVTHAWHIPRAMRVFSEQAGADIRVVPAPIGLLTPGDRPVLDWLPSSYGFTQVRDVLREMLGLLVRA
jgi:uncharacterized SAM-binding protein YcdF (DUF218 family)